MQLRKRRHCLKTIRDQTGSQCSSSRIADEIEPNLEIRRISRAAAFRIDCRRSSWYQFTPNIALSQKSSREHTNACTRVRSALRVYEWRTTRIRQRWKKQTCDNFVMWSTIDSSWSKRRSRFRATLSDTNAAEMLDSATVSRCPSFCRVPNHRYFAFIYFIYYSFIYVFMHFSLIFVSDNSREIIIIAGVIASVFVIATGFSLFSIVKLAPYFPSADMN